MMPHQSLIICLCLALMYGCSGKNGDSKNRQIEYVCEESTTVMIEFFEDTPNALLVLKDKSHLLSQKRIASGFYYSNQNHAIRGKGDEMILTVVSEDKESIKNCQNTNH